VKFPWHRILLSIGSLLPYWPLLTFSVLFIPDNHFTSDIFNGELPGRILVGQLVRAGEWPLWTSQICSGYPLAGAPADPLGLVLFAVLPPAAALDALVIAMLLVAAHGTYSFARRLGAEPAGAILAGIAFANSGYFVFQLQHLSILSTVAWLPVGLVLIDRIFAVRRRPPAAARATAEIGLLMATLGLMYANQVLAGFPQAAYISGLVYGSFALFRAVEGWQPGGLRAGVTVIGGIAAALVLGALAGAVVLLPLAELTSLSDRVAPLDYRWATYTNFWPRNFFTFFVPYINGDASNGTYIGPPPFWEQYGYVGAATAALAIYGAIRERRRAVIAFVILMTLVAVAFILGPRTPAYYVAYLLVPGMNAFRAPTRFMVVVDLGLVLLAAIGLTRLRADLARRSVTGSRMPQLIAIGLCAGTVADLWIHQARQNPMVPARDWLAPPRTVEIVRADSPAPRTFTPHHRDVHRAVHDRNPGWTNLEPYFKLRDLLEPNTGGGYWNVPSADCYVGLAPRWYVTVWSYHYFENSFISESAFQELHGGTLSVKPGFINQLRTYGVTHVLGPYPGRDPALTELDRGPNAYVYRVEGTARVRVVRAARRLMTEANVVAHLRDPHFDPDREILLLGAPESVRPIVGESPTASWDTPPRAVITHEGPRELVIDAFAPEDGFLFLADLYYPGWTAQVNGADTPIYRANVSGRGIALPKGQHTVRFTFDSAPFSRGLKISAGALAALALWLAAAAYRVYV
jgi:hypothetical protein